MKFQRNKAAGEMGLFVVDGLRGKLFRVIGMIVLLAIAICFGGVGFSRDQVDTATLNVETKSTIDTTKRIHPKDVFVTPDLSKYENCTISWSIPNPKSEWKTQPLWLASFPASGSQSPSGQGDVLRPIINGITGLDAGNKAFIASNKNLRHCHGLSETAACSGSSDNNPDRNTNSFNDNVIFVIRNVKDAWPAFYFDKGLAYREETEQASEEIWRQVRDTFLTSGLELWCNEPFWWIKSDYYKIGMYVQYEKLLNVETGPTVVERLAEQFEAAGFTVAPKQDIPCIWYHAVKEEWKRQLEYYTYIPGYTPEQITMMLTKLEQGIHDAATANDQELERIFKEYADDIRESTIVDIPWNGTAAR